MTVEQLYQWAKENDALDLEIEVFDSYGDYTSYIEPEIINYSEEYREVRL